MLILPPYEYDYQIYHKTPMEDRWIFSKLTTAEKMGHICGPAGTWPPHGRYCFRATHSVRGKGFGGWYDITYDGNGEDLLIPGYFWCEWFEGETTWAEYINDRFSAGLGGVVDEDTGLMTVYETEAIPMEPQFRGISRYMTIERIGGRVVEAAPRLMAVCARRKAVLNYQQIDPTYEPTDLEYGVRPYYQRIVNAEGGYEWTEYDGPKAPWGGDKELTILPE